MGLPSIPGHVDSLHLFMSLPKAKQKGTLDTLMDDLHNSNSLF